MATMSPISPMANRMGFVSSPPPAGGVMSPLSPTSAAGVGGRVAAQTTAPFSSVKSNTTAPARPSSTSVGFDDLWNMSLGSSKPTTPSASAGGTKSIKDLEKEKAQASIWGGVGGVGGAKPGGGFGGASSMGFGVGAGTFGASNINANASSGTSTGGDDLLL